VLQPQVPAGKNHKPTGSRAQHSGRQLIFASHKQNNTAIRQAAAAANPPVQHVDAAPRGKHESRHLHDGIALDGHIGYANLGVFGFDLVATRRFFVHAAALQQDAGEDEVVGDGAMFEAARWR
jgi:hypothetical protein